MTGPEHYRKAETALSILDVERDPEEWDAAIRSGDLMVAMTAAQVHATLALAAATALTIGVDDSPIIREWAETAGSVEFREQVQR
jgi:hypothetical protein